MSRIIKNIEDDVETGDLIILKNVNKNTDNFYVSPKAENFFNRRLIVGNITQEVQPIGFPKRYVVIDEDTSFPATWVSRILCKNYFGIREKSIAFTKWFEKSKPYATLKKISFALWACAWFSLGALIASIYKWYSSNFNVGGAFIKYFFILLAICIVARYFVTNYMEYILKEFAKKFLEKNSVKDTNVKEKLCYEGFNGSVRNI